MAGAALEVEQDDALGFSLGFSLPIVRLAMFFGAKQGWKIEPFEQRQGACLKYLMSMAGRMVLTLPPRMLPAKSIEAKTLCPAVGEIGWFTVL